MKKPAIFMDAFLTDDARHEVFNYNVSNFIKHGWDVFIISNKISHFGNFSGVKYFEYDSRNRILADKSKYILPDTMSFYADFSNDTHAYRFDALAPTHGFTNWTLLYNMRRMATIAKKFGHTHFITCEYDVKFKNYNLLDNIFKGFGETEKSKTCMAIRYGTYGCITNLYLISVDFVLERIPEMETEEDYSNFLCTLFGSPSSPIFESLFFNTLIGGTIDKETGEAQATHAEIIPKEQFFDNIEDWGIHISDGDRGLRQYLMYKGTMMSPANNNTKFFLFNLHPKQSVFVEYSTDTTRSLHLLNPNNWVIMECAGAAFVNIRTSDSITQNNPVIHFDLSIPWNATITQIKP